MSTGYRYAAARLADLPPDDRQWLYGQLSSDERMDLVALLSLREHVEGDMSAGRSTVLSPEEKVAQASPWQISQAFADVSDWVAALILSRRSWAWSADYLEGIGDSKAAQLRVLAATLKESSRDAAYGAAVKGLAEKIERLVSESMERQKMETGEVRLMNVRPVDD